MNYSIKPEEHELKTARRIIENCLKTCQAIEEKNESFEVVLGGKSRGNFEEKGAFGEAWNENLIRIYFNSDHGDTWKEDLRTITSYSYGESLFLEKSDSKFHWQELLKKSYALMFLKQTGFEPNEIDRDKARDEWQEFDEESSISWSLAHFIGERLLEGRNLNEIPTLKKSDVLKAGDKVFS